MKLTRPSSDDVMAKSSIVLELGEGLLPPAGYLRSADRVDEEPDPGPEDGRAGPLAVIAASGRRLDLRDDLLQRTELIRLHQREGQPRQDGASRILPIPASPTTVTSWQPVPTVRWKAVSRRRRWSWRSPAFAFTRRFNPELRPAPAAPRCSPSAG